MTTILHKIQQIAENESITIGALERKIGASKGVISRALANGTDIQSKWVQQIGNNYPRYSAGWLLTGEGDMLKVSDTKHYNEPPVISTPFKASDVETRPRIPLNVAAGALSVCQDGVTLSQCEQMPVIRAFSRYDFTILVNGESMEPELHSGDELACLYVNNASFIQWGRPHILDTPQGIVVKRIFDGGDTLICESDNNRFHSYSIPKQEVYNIALVVGMLRRY